MLRQGGKSVAIIKDGRRKIHTTFEGGGELVEEYDLQTEELIIRKRREPTAVGGEGPWVFEVGGAEQPRLFNPVNDLLTESSLNPIFTRKDSERAFEWRIRNLPYPSSTYSVTLNKEERVLIVRTTNKKYFKRISIPELDRLKLPLEDAAVGWSHANNTLIISYAKPMVVLDSERKDRKDRSKVPVAPLPKEGDVDCKQQ